MGSRQMPAGLREYRLIDFRRHVERRRTELGQDVLELVRRKIRRQILIVVMRVRQPRTEDPTGT